jgi:transcriptional regulator with XRE-family HTH domain
MRSYKGYKFKKLRECREAANICNTALMFDLDKKFDMRVSRQTLINWERGKTAPDANEAMKLAQFYKKPIDFFFEEIAAA